MDRIQGYLNAAWSYLQTVVQLISFWDVLDMVIVAFLIYNLLKFVRKTNSGSLIKAIGILLIALWISNLAHLTSVNFILSRVFDMGIIMLVVLFQPEIRRMLEQVGNSRLTDLVGTKQQGAKMLDNAITQTVLACSDMSDSKTGALIVFERSVNLDIYIKTGTIVDAAVAVELLKNIFYNRAPLHDGAVIIRDGRIAGAACMLPLSGNTHIASSLGMRHRAGIGMSEKTDAVVVIISEETGDISVALEGVLKRGLEPATLEKLIRSELLPTEEDKKGIFKRVRGSKDGSK